MLFPFHPKRWREPPLLGCPLLFIKDFYRCLLYLEFVSTRIVRAHHMVVSRGPLDIITTQINIINTSYIYDLVKVPHCSISECFRAICSLYTGNRKKSDANPRLCALFHVVCDVSVLLVATPN
jgi:hypothetical protein